MAAGAGQPHRRTAARACECCKGSDAVHAPAGLTHKPPTEAPAVGLFFCLVLGGIPEIVLHPPLHRTEKEKPRYLLDSGVSFTDLVPER